MLHKDNPTLIKGLVNLQHCWELSPKSIEEITGISKLNLYAQRDKGHPLSQSEKQAITCLLDIYSKLNSFFGGNKDNCLGWLKSNNMAFQNETPVDYMKKKEGVFVVRDYLKVCLIES